MDRAPINGSGGFPGNGEDLGVGAGEDRTSCVKVDTADLPLVTCVSGVPDRVVDLLVVDGDAPEAVVDGRHSGGAGIGSEGIEGSADRRAPTGGNAIDQAILQVGGEELVEVGIVGDIADAGS